MRELERTRICEGKCASGFAQCNKELAGIWKPNQNGPGFACVSCYNTFGTGKKAKAAADPKQTAITQFFKKQKQ